MEVQRAVSATRLPEVTVPELGPNQSVSHVLRRSTAQVLQRSISRAMLLASSVHQEARSRQRVHAALDVMDQQNLNRIQIAAGLALVRRRHTVEPARTYRRTAMHALRARRVLEAGLLRLRPPRRTLQRPLTTLSYSKLQLVEPVS